MDKFFAIFGKVVLVLIGGVILVGGGYFLAKHSGLSLQKSSSTITQTEATVEPTSTPTPNTAKTVPAGLPASSKLSFSAYLITFPQEWAQSEQKDLNVAFDKLILTKGNYTISIYQAATGGAQCIYPGDKAPEGPSAMFTSYVEFSGTANTVYRRGPIDSTNIPTQNFGVCARAQGNASFGQPSPFGHILYTAPKNFDPKILIQMDSIVATLTKAP